MLNRIHIFIERCPHSAGLLCANIYIYISFILRQHGNSNTSSHNSGPDQLRHVLRGRSHMEKLWRPQRSYLIYTWNRIEWNISLINPGVGFDCPGMNEKTFEPQSVLELQSCSLLLLSTAKGAHGDFGITKPRPHNCATASYTPDPFPCIIVMLHDWYPWGRAWWPLQPKSCAWSPVVFWLPGFPATLSSSWTARPTREAKNDHLVTKRNHISL